MAASDFGADVVVVALVVVVVVAGGLVVVAVAIAVVVAIAVEEVADGEVVDVEAAIVVDVASESEAVPQPPERRPSTAIHVMSLLVAWSNLRICAHGGDRRRGRPGHMLTCQQSKVPPQATFAAGGR
jgi:steroid 5-alpha reductase family enzyme